jgi:LDH2 family malate/lactate/ureidoglycolate dehydrogenase
VFFCSQVEWAQRQGLPIPGQWVADARGQPTTDPDAVLLPDGGGALLPLGGLEETGGSGVFLFFVCQKMPFLPQKKFIN